MTETAVDIAVAETGTVDYTKIIRMTRLITGAQSLEGLLIEVQDLISVNDLEQANTLMDEAREISYEVSEQADNVSSNLLQALQKEKHGLDPEVDMNSMDYELVTGSDASELKAAVVKHTSEGWNVSGGVVIGPDGSFYQPMIRHNSHMVW